jgi:hypothetical protein
MTQCTAKSKRSGDRCRRHAMTGSKVCYMHGGKTPVGPASPHYKSGRYSKYLPHNLRTRYEESLDDPQLLELRSEVALLDARLGELLEKADTGENRKLWSRVSTLWAQYRRALEAGEAAEQDRLTGLLTATITDGQGEAQAWLEIQKSLELRRKLADTEQRRMQTAQQMVTVEQAIALVAATIAALKEVVERHAGPSTARDILVDASATYQRLISLDGEM